MCCVISSLVQLLLDPHWRTIVGFQSLIQKEWVSLGHPFCDRIGHIVSDSNERGPLFLLFLDCCWQLLQQFPEDFEFGETFLTTIWDSVFIPVFDTFQFNSEHDRYQAMRNEKLIPRPVWDWAEQFHEKDIALFSNPLYRKPVFSEAEVAFNRRSKLPPSAVQLPCLNDLKLINAKNNPKSYRMSARISVPASTETSVAGYVCFDIVPRL
jgi:myotubularin-related protein 10/11/12